MTDLHTHILPGMDNGARVVEMSLEMLQQKLGEQSLRLISRWAEKLAGQ